MPVPVAEAVTGTVKEAAPARGRPAPAGPAGPQDRREPLYRECQGYQLRLDPPDLARLRELAGARGKSDDEIGEAFFDGQAERLAASIARRRADAQRDPRRGGSVLAPGVPGAGEPNPRDPELLAGAQMSAVMTIRVAFDSRAFF